MDWGGDCAATADSIEPSVPAVLTVTVAEHPKIKGNKGGCAAQVRFRMLITVLAMAANHKAFQRSRS